MALRRWPWPLLLGIAGYAALFVAPTERTMGVIQRIFYFHVPSGWIGFRGLRHRLRREHRLSAQRARRNGIGWRFPRRKSASRSSPSVLVTGPIWAHPVWGIWWTWDARLTSAFVLWVLYVSYLLLRTLIDEPERRAVVSAVFGIFAAVRYSSGLFFDLVFPHPASAAGDRRWRLARSAHGQRAAALLGRDAGRAGACCCASAIAWKRCAGKSTALRLESARRREARNERCD